MQNITQFKFSNGQEVVCEVMEWPEESNEKDIIVRNAMAILMGETEFGERMYMFRPWAHCLESPDEYIIINSLHVVSTNRPSEYLLEEYHYAVAGMHMNKFERDAIVMQQKLEQEKKLKNTIDKIVEMSVNDSASVSTGAKIIQFPRSADDIIH